MRRTPDTIAERLEQAQSVFCSPQLRAVFDRAQRTHQRQLDARAMRSDRPAWVHLPTEHDGIDQGECVLGPLPFGGQARLSLRGAGGLTILNGKPGSGKSVLLHRLCADSVRLGTPTVLINTKDAVGTPLPVPVPMLIPRQVALALDAPPGISAARWHADVLRHVESVVFLYSGSTIITQAIEHAQPPLCCLAEVGWRLEQQQAVSGRWSRTEGFKESAIAGLRRLTHGHPLFSARTMWSWNERVQTSFGVFLASVPSEAARLFTFLTLWVLALVGAQVSNPTRQVRSRVLLDDARVLIRNVDRPGAAAVDPILDLLDKGQSWGLDVIVALQSLDEIPPSILRAAQRLVLVGAQTPEDLRLLKDRLSLTPDQYDDALRQGRGNAIIHLRDHSYSWPFPVRLLGPEALVDIHAAQNQQRRAHGALALDQRVQLWQSPASPPADSAAPRRAPSVPSGSPERNLPPLTHSFLSSVLRHPHYLASEHAQVCGVQGRELSAVRDDLASRGFVAVHPISRYTLLEPLRPGADAVGMNLESLPGIGAFPHRWGVQRLRQHHARTTHRIVCEFTVGDARYDLYAESRDGTREAFELVLARDTLERAIEKLAVFVGTPNLIVIDRPTADRARTLATGHVFQIPLRISTLQEMVAVTRPPIAGSSPNTPGDHP